MFVEPPPIPTPIVRYLAAQAVESRAFNEKVPNVGHIPMVERPEETARGFLDFLERTPRGAAAS